MVEQLYKHLKCSSFIILDFALHFLKKLVENTQNAPYLF